MSAAVQAFQHANPHALASIVEASATRKIVASQDIYDDRGTKLWARDQPVSHSLHQRLMERRLKQPIESCLRAEDGVTTSQLHESLAAFVEGSHGLACAVRPWASRLLDEVQRIPLHAAVQLLLTTAHATKPAVYEHAVRGMALAGAVQASLNPARFEVRLAMLGGLLHDLGEMYVHPQYLEGGGRLDAAGYRHVVTHPRVGELLLATMTDYPPALARAVGEHHERLDGLGYPMRRSGDSISPLGRLLAVTETVLAVTDAPTVPLARASHALRMLPGEYDHAFAGFVTSAATHAHEDLEGAVAEDPGDVVVQLALIDTEISLLQAEAQALARDAASARVREVAQRAAALLHRLRMGWNATGLWCTSPPDDSPRSVFELSRARDELRFRMRAMERDCLWPYPELSDSELLQMSGLWSAVQSQAVDAGNGPTELG